MCKICYIYILPCMHTYIMDVRVNHQIYMNMYVCAETDVPVAVPLPVAAPVSSHNKYGSNDDDEDSSVGDRRHTHIPPCPSYFGYPEDTQWSIHCSTCRRKDWYSKPGMCASCDLLRIRWVQQFFLGHASSPVLCCYNPS